ncbi:MAG: ROK family transcriptional regulator [Firmicutes bacterium]|nr:ROK family transcriptional regulator [Bacillota bacterium]
MNVRTGDHMFVKQLNKTIVLNTLRRHSPISRAEIAKITGLNKSTVSALVDELLNEHLAREIGPGASQGGRRPQLLVLNTRAGVVVGAEIGVNYLTVIIQDLLGQPIWQHRAGLRDPHNPETTLGQLADTIRQGLQHVPETPLGLMGIGLGIPGLVDYEHGRLLFAPNLRWEDVDVRAWFQERFEAPVKVDNEANAGALAEHWSGAGAGLQNVVYFSLGIGIGAGIIIQGELYRGHGGLAGELGHTTIDMSGPLCSCGSRGCLEAMASEAALRRYFTAHPAYTAPIPEPEPGPDHPAPFIEGIVQAAKEGNGAAIAALRDVGRYLGIGIANAINTFNPQRVIIGGPLALGGDNLLNPARQVVRERALAAPREQAEITLSAHGPDACAIGAGVLILEDLYRLPAVVL